MPKDVPVVRVYSGDTLAFPTYTFLKDDQTGFDFVADGWTDWRAQWMRGRSKFGDKRITLEVDASRADEGVIMILASPADTEAMRGSGVWDLQAIRGDEVRTWLRGDTTWTEDVTE